MKMRDLLDSPDKWTKGAYARNAAGNECLPIADEACCWCLRGAFIRCYADTKTGEAAGRKLLVALNALDDKYKGRITMFNDNPSTTFEDIRRLLELADV